MKSRVHPKYKTQYHVGNWPAYDRALVQRGDITVWLAPDAIATWEAVGVGKRGGQLQYSDLAIETALTLRLIFHLPLRQTEGFLTSIFGMLGLDLSTPDHTTLSRRGQHLDLPLRRAPAGAGLHLIVDSTGLSIVGEGEWAAAKHGGRGRRGWKKLHLGVDRSGVIVARALTEASVDDATTGITLIEATDGALGRVTADAAYDTIGFYEAAGARGATDVVPPTRTANVSRYGPRSGARDRTILAVKERGRRRWKKTSGYHGQARVENAFFRYKSIIGDSLRACSPAGRGTEVVLACNILNQAISEFPKWRKYLILLSFLDNSSARPVQIGGVDVNICHSRSTAVRGRRRSSSQSPPRGPFCRTRTGPVEADGAVDAQNAPTAPWKTLCVFHELPQGLSHQVTHEKLRKAPKYRWEIRIDP